jgi:Putative abortive phage resistance protein AbiGi, antitoxin
MYIHFTFGELAKSGKLEEQFSEITNKIVIPKRLKVSVCQEFIPIPNESSGNIIHFDLTKGTLEKGGFNLTTEHTTSPPSISYLPEDVPMICFIKCSLKKLKNHPHKNEYGKLGIVFTEKFYRKNKLRQVSYYDEESVKKDPLIKKYTQNNLNDHARRNLSKEITTYRKPKTLTENFSKSTVARISASENGSSLNFYTYDRYRIGYDFTIEAEYRIAFEPQVDFLHFEESDVFMIIVPNMAIEEKLVKFLKKNWATIPRIAIFPE